MSSEQGAQKAALNLAPSLPLSLETLKKRSDFLSIGKCGKRFSCPFFVLITNKRSTLSHHSDIRVGYTVSKKVSKKAVTRNRIKRRLREAVRQEAPYHASAGFDYILIARQAAETCPFDELTERLRFGLKWLHKNAERK